MHSKPGCSFGDVAVSQADGFLNDPPLLPGEIESCSVALPPKVIDVDRLDVPAARECDASGIVADDLDREVADPDDVVCGESYDPVNNVLELTDIAGPFIVGETREGIAVHTNPPPVHRRKALEEMFYEHDDVAAATAQRRKDDRDHVDPVIQSLLK